MSVATGIFLCQVVKIRPLPGSNITKLVEFLLPGMALTKIQKQKIINDLKEKFARQKAIVFADFKGLKVKDLSQLRKAMKKQDCELKVAKKTLISLVLKEKKIDIDVKKMAGEIVLGFGYKDEILPFKLFYGFSKTNENLKILGGLTDGEIVDKEKALALGQLPSRDELLVRLMVNVLKGNLRNLVYALSQIKGQA